MDANDLCPWCNKFKETELLGDYERGNGFWLQICKLEMQLISWIVVKQAWQKNNVAWHLWKDRNQWVF